MGNFPHESRASVRVIANSSVWMESVAVDQLHTTAKLPHMVAAVGMPDLHPGRGYPVGATFFTKNHIYPALIGGDIGCGMTLWELDLKAHKMSASILEKSIGCIDEPCIFNAAAQEELEELIEEGLNFPLKSLMDMCGTLGGGNHFLEVIAVDEILAQESPIEKKKLYLLVHSGSRGLGGSILRDHIDQFGHTGFSADTQAAREYMLQHNLAQRFAFINRVSIARRVIEGRLKCNGKMILDITHNHVTEQTIGGVAGYLHRKGAAPDQSLSIIPGSRGDYSYLVQGHQCEDTLLSLAHGAGRAWARSDCMGRLSRRFKAEDLSKTKFGSRVVCSDKALLFEEAPEAYKSIGTVIDSLIDANLITALARFKPVLTYKKGWSTCC